MPVDCGSITPSSAQAATAASAAVPPDRSTSIAASAASGCEVATIAFRECTVDRPARWKFLMPKCSPLSLFSCVSTASYRRDLQRVTWHIHPLLGNGGRCIPSSRIEEFLSGLSLIPPGECEPIEYERALSFPLRPRANEGALRGEQG